MELRKIKIFVEGKDDQLLIRDCLKVWYNIELPQIQINELIVITNGYTSLSMYENTLKEINKGEKREGGINIVIFDADKSNGETSDENSGFPKKQTYLNMKIFLFQIIKV
jgi:hypothetical protein